MKLLRSLILGSGALLLGGCTVVTVTPGPDLSHQLDGWVKTREYGRALNTLSRIDPKSPEYQQFAERRKQIETLARAYEQEVIEKAKQSVERGDWAAALNAYDTAIERLPESTVLRDGLAALHQKQSQKVAEQELDLLINRARWLQSSLPSFETIARVTPRDPAAQQAYQDRKAALADAAEQLGKMGAAALEAGDYGLADRTLPLAAELSKTEFITKANNKLNAWHTAQRRQKQVKRERRLRQAEARQAATQRRYEQLSQEYRKAVDAGKLQNARKILSSLEQLVPNDADLEDERKQLDAQINSEAERLYQLGVRLYSRGEFEKAAADWRRVLELVPDHKSAAESLDRAERVLEKIKQLREKQADGRSVSLKG